MNIAETPIGSLAVKEVFLSYDGPKLFSCESLSGQSFVALSVEIIDEAERWFFAPASLPGLLSLRSGKVPLREAFLNPADGWIWEFSKFQLRSRRPSQ